MIFLSPRSLSNRNRNIVEAITLKKCIAERDGVTKWRLGKSGGWFGVLGSFGGHFAAPFPEVQAAITRIIPSSANGKRTRTRRDFKSYERKGPSAFISSFCGQNQPQGKIFLQNISRF